MRRLILLACLSFASLSAHADPTTIVRDTSGSINTRARVLKFPDGSLTNSAGTVTVTFSTATGGSGTVNTGVANQLSYYPAASAAVSPVPHGSAINAAGYVIGSILQVVQSTTSTAFTTTNTTWTLTNLVGTITPLSSTSKIRVTVYGATETTAAIGRCQLTIYRNSVNLSNDTGFTQIRVGGAGTAEPATMSYLDSPATTSALTYKVYMVTDGVVQLYGFSTGVSEVSIMHLEEIAQ